MTSSRNAKLAEWILTHLGRTCRCISPRFTRTSSYRTSHERHLKLLIIARQIALDAGLRYVYEGNIKRWREHQLSAVRGTARPPFLA